MKKLTSANSGASAIEFAIIFPVFIMLIITMIEVSLYLYNDMLVNKASKEAIREASIGGDKVAVENKLKNYFGDDIYKTVDGSDYDENRKDKQMIQWGVKTFDLGFDDSRFESFAANAAKGDLSYVINGESNLGEASESGKIAVLAICHNESNKLNVTHILPQSICTWNLTRYENFE